MRSISRRNLLAFILAGLASALGVPARAETAAGAPAKPVFKACDVPNVPGGGRCATYEVWEDRATGKGRKIGLHVLVLPALSKTPAPDPVFWLHGGPGAAASGAAPGANGGFLEGLRADHDLVFVDQRGTGQSHPLNCDLGDDSTDLPSYFGKLLPTELVRACRQVLERDADLALYTTTIAMDDLDEVRGALGYEKIDLVAASYGSIAAQAYIRQHGDRVRAAFLTGVATPGIKQPLPFARGAQEALDLLYKDCDADAACRAAFPNFRNEFDAVLARFGRGAIDVRMIDPVTKKERRVTLERESYVERLRLLLYTTTFAQYVPLIVHRAFQDDWIPFESVAIAYNPGSILARGMYMTITCSEGVPFITEPEVAATRGTFVGERRVRAHEDACKEWVRGRVPASFIEPIRSSVPVLMFSGEADGSTPQWLGKGAVQSLANGRQIEVPHYGHQVDSPCMWSVMGQFIRTASVRDLDTSCVSGIRRPPFATEIPPAFAIGGGA
jgi:pimeloyl-ACP methyl ester carboxylesterase